jgi:hypothetical protein
LMKIAEEQRTSASALVRKLIVDFIKTVGGKG